MRKTIFALATVAFIAGTMLTGCQSSAENLENAYYNKQALYQAHQDSITVYQKFRIKHERRIIANEETIADYKAWIANENKENRAVYENRLALLEKKINDLKKKLSDHNEDGNDAWRSFQSELSHDMDELGKALKDVIVDNAKYSGI